MKKELIKILKKPPLNSGKINYDKWVERIYELIVKRLESGYLKINK